ncbi:MAG TPA: tRNA (guanine(46)-N(7))-methyltransferase TrmB [Lichenihabitans sp.]|jgi:tRNA (guanine-N7-)-methyltransferase|nr:tRNA (guanine(46)-N(7))-methyltransferase TrmB [Lichenihabitans sp.]
MGEDGGERHRAGILHGRRAGRPLRAAQRAAIDRLLPGLEIGLEDLDDPAALFRRPVRSLRIEIGFGGGEHLAAEAARLPETGFIGCEPFRNGVAKLVRQVEDLGLDNLRIHAGDAGEVLDALPQACLEVADILYPDPWPKRRQRKRRFVSDENLARLARVLRPGGLVRFATDIDDYAGWVLARVLRSPEFLWVAKTAEDWRHPWPDWPSTRYEAKALRDGRRPVYLTITRR